VIGGMLAASLIAIFLIPVSFYVVERIAGRGAGGRPRAHRRRRRDRRPGRTHS
jgi:hypothetical protein